MALTDLLERIDTLKQEADALRPLSPENTHRLNDKLRLEWTYHSNAIEGNTLTLSETRVLLQQGIHMGNKLGRHYEEMKLHEEVIFALEEIVHDKRAFNEVLIRQLHHRLMGDDYFVDAFDSLGEPKKVKGKPGEYKDMTNGVRRIVNGKEKFVPFKTPDEVRIEMPELVSWFLTDEHQQEYHPVVRAAILHYRFVTLHPFDDGNGRMGRILMNLALMRAGYVPAIVRVEEREQYIRNLAIAQDGGDLEPFLELVAQETLRSMELLVKAAKGESIEEPGDLKKTIALLKKEALSKSKIYKSPKKVYEVFQLIQRMVWRPLLKELEEIDDLFNEHKIIKRVDGLNEFYPTRTKNRLLPYIEEETTKPKEPAIFGHEIYENDIKDVDWELTYFSLKGAPNIRNMELKLSIKFDNDHYTISAFVNKKNTFSTTYVYNSFPFEEESKNIVTHIIKAMVSDIREALRDSN